MDGFMANFWFVSDAGNGVPKLTFVVRDDNGNQYESWTAGMRGAGKPSNDPARWRIGLNFAPVIVQIARIISFEMPEIRLLAYASESNEWAIRERWVGPWIYTVALPIESEGGKH